jgi:uncharacterized protein
MREERGPAEQPFMEIQRAIAAHIRDPLGRPCPAHVEERRMAIYRDLVFNNVASLLAANFPVTRQILDDDHWADLIRGFFVHHRCTTPLFHELAQEFLAYLQDDRAGDPQDPAFLLELAHYEWVEMALDIAEDTPLPAPTDPNGELLAGCPAVSPLAWSLCYRFPVHCIGPGHLPEVPPVEPTRLVVYRNRQGQVEFMEVNVVTQRLLELLQEDRATTGLAALTRIAAELCHPRPDQVIAAGRQLLADLRGREVVLGTWL